MTRSAEEYGHRRATVTSAAAAVGRPAPEAGLNIFVLLGESRAYVREMFEDAPLAKLMALLLRPEYFRQHGIEHPLGTDHRGVVDVVPHEMDPERLAAIAPTIPVEIVEQQVMTGDIEEIGRDLQAYDEHGCEHVVLINITGAVGGVAEARVQAPHLEELCHMLRSLHV